jgi:P27 family predicted phage terminase small subunit
MGRKAKPTKIKKLEGNPGKYPLNNDPEFTGYPSCPDFLKPEAKIEWNRVVPELDRVGLLTLVDQAALAGYCESWAKWMEAEIYLQENGSVFEMKKFNKEGAVISVYYLPRPEVAIANQSQMAVLKFCSEFGMTPASRAKISSPAMTKESTMGDLLD